MNRILLIFASAITLVTTLFVTKHMMHSTPGAIVLFNGTSSAGKSVIINELQKTYGTSYTVVKIDDFEKNYLNSHPKLANGLLPDEEMQKIATELWDSFYQHIKQLSQSGKNVFIDTVQFDDDYEKYSKILDNGRLIKILVYCPLDRIIERVEKRNKSNDPSEQRTVAQAFGQFPAIYKLQESSNEPIVDRIDSKRMLNALNKAKTEIDDLIKAAPQDKLVEAIKSSERFYHDFVRHFKLSDRGEIVLTSKHRYDLIINSDTQTPAANAQHIADYLRHNDTIGANMDFEFPALTGSYSVGTTSRHIIDQTRKEPQNQSAQRELMVYLWYPAQSNEKNPRVVYLADDIEATKQSLKQAGYPEKDLTALDSVYSHAVPDAPVLREKAPYPVIIFSHGYRGCLPVDYTAFCEELASHGYVVASIAHTYYASVVKFPDGRQIKPSKEIAPLSHDIQEMWAVDAQVTLDALARMNADAHDQFYNCMDMQRVGMIGHSMGGATAFRLCLHDPRFKIGISLDASPWSQDKPVAEMKKPFLFIFAEQTVEDFKKSDAELATTHGISVDKIKEISSINQRQLRTDIIVPHTKHAGFSDYMLFKDMPLFKNNKHIFDLETMCGTANGAKTIQLINQSMVKFLKENLNP